ncbi:MAG: hypothetical protein ACFFD4_40840 [Candidatus Odinarchaeota archaeon]
MKAELLSGKQKMTRVTTSSQREKVFSAMVSSSERGRKTITSKESTSMNYSQLTAACLFKQGKHGPVACTGNALPAGLDTNDLSSLGCYYSLALGQGKHYNEGQYGPLPVLGTGFHSLLHAKMVKDSQQEDLRMDSRNYLVLCFFYHGQLEETIQGNRPELTRLFNAFFTASNTVEKAVYNLELFEVLIRHRIFCMNACSAKVP